MKEPMTIKYSQEQWHEILHSYGINPGLSSYNLVDKIRILYHWKEKNTFKSYLRKEHHFDDGDFFADHLNSIRYFLTRSISLQNIDALDSLMSKENDKHLMFRCLINICHILHGASNLSRVATNSDFWHCVDNGQIYDRDFLSFHLVNYLYHTKSYLPDESHRSNITKILSMNCHSEIYTEEKINESRLFNIKLIDKIYSIIDSGYFDQNFAEFNNSLEELAKNPKVNSIGENLYEFLYEHFHSGYRTSPMYTYHLKKLTS